ncbi:hypothetical protein KQH60_03855 [Mycetohabitans sp. B8]|uniref:hypothetical protein n=1 Tax=Mycetohabitans sp. B8 TaxID=2841845 RepID=UPI001F28C1A2|nr:hypothetical protein [Mycetohabitans sp. B8]MCG1041753.1 hypothetical protein [Mycetohabitans sp. B8]
MPHGYVEAENHISRAEKANATRRTRGKEEAPPDALSSVANKVYEKISIYIPTNIKSKSKKANFVSISKNSNIYAGIDIDVASGGGLRMNEERSGLIGVPYKGSKNPCDPILEYDVDKNELIFRSMSKSDYEHLKSTRELKPTTETSISPAIAYSLEYACPEASETIQFILKPGTSEELQTIGLSMGKAAEERFPTMTKSLGKWAMTNAQFKSEGKQMTTQLGQGDAINIFNKCIVDYKPIQRIFK